MNDELQIVEYKGVRVVTSRQIAEMYETENARVKQGFNRNKRKFTEGKHYFKIDGEELKSFREVYALKRSGVCGYQNETHKICGGQNDDCKNLQSAESGLQISNKTRVLYLWTNRGALLLAKIIDTDKAWQAYERLVDFYFEVKDEDFKPPIERFPEEPQKITYRTSSTPVPKNPSWQARNRRRINILCEKAGISISHLYHHILLRLGEEYDLNAANEIYEKELGHVPKYSMDIVSYFPELARMADAYLDRIEEVVSQQERDK